jgi:hypothetical protein
MFPAVNADVSNITNPWTVRDEENGPKVMAAVLLADPAGEAAAVNKAVCRVYPSPPGLSSEAETLVGTPEASAANRLAGCVTAAPVPPSDQSSNDLAWKAAMLAIF